MNETEQFIREVVEAFGDDGTAQEDLVKAVSEFHGMQAQAAIFDAWRNGSIRVVGYYDDALWWAVRK